MSQRPKIVLLGMLTKMPVGGVAWLMGQYIVGFERLGFDVYYVEAHARTPSMFILDEMDDGTDAAAGYLAKVMSRFGIGDRWAFQALHADGRYVGMNRDQLRRVYREAALILNMHGGTVPLPEHAEAGRLVLLNTDPVELELEIERGHAPVLAFLEPHVAAFTWALNYGNPDCRLPWSADHVFVPSPPPVVLDMWDNGGPPARAPFTTIGNWRQDWREVRFEGEHYGWSKHREFAKIIDLPSRVAATLELALSSASDADRAMLRGNGWVVEDGLRVSQDLDDYRRYLIRSAGEFTVAKDQNVRFRTGWFSERSACYLAAGRPVVMQDTGFAEVLGAGAGLLAFEDVDTAAAAVAEVASHPARHQRAAREIAEDSLSHTVVLPAMLDHLGIAIPNRPPTGSGRDRCRPLPGELPLVPKSRRPLVLPDSTSLAVATRPVPAHSTPVADPRTSIVMVVLDNLVLTRMAVESVLANTDDRFELILVDNGSEDSTRHYLRVLSSRHAKVRLIRNERNLGFAPAVNQGLAAARGDVLVLLNNDVIVPPGWLDPLLDRLSDQAVGLVGPATNRCGNEAEVAAVYTTYAELLEFVEERGRAADVDEYEDFDIAVAMMFCVAMRRETYAAVGGLDERYELALFEDDDYARRVRATGRRVVCSPRTFVHHFGEGSLGHLAADGRYGELFASNRRRFEVKWGEPWRPHARRPDRGYIELVARVRRLIEAHLPGEAVTLVASRGDEQLVPPDQDRLRHFPSSADGVYSGHYPADDDDAIAQIESHRRSGAEYLVIPATALWWLDHYERLAGHLASNPPIVNEPGTAVIFDLATDSRSRRDGGDGPERIGLAGAEATAIVDVLTRLSSRIDRIEDMLDELASPGPGADDDLAARCRAAIRSHVPRGGRVLASGFDGTASISPAAREIVPLAIGWVDVGGGSSGTPAADTISAIAAVEAARAIGSQFLVVAGADAARFESRPRLVDHLVGHYEELARDSDLLVFDLRRRRSQSRALSSLVSRLECLTSDDPAILDWTGRGLAADLAGRNVFSARAASSLPHLDRSVPVVIVDEPAQWAEAARVASLAVVTVADGDRSTFSDVHVVDPGLAHALEAHSTLGLVLAGATDDGWLESLVESLGPHDVRLTATAGTQWPADGLDLLVIGEQVLVLPGSIDAMRGAAASARAGGVAVKLLERDGSLAAAGVTVFEDRTWMGTAAGCMCSTAPWHEFLRPTGAAAGLLFVPAESVAALRRVRDLPPSDLFDWTAAVWESGSRVIYQPEAIAVRLQPPEERRPRPMPALIACRVGRDRRPPPVGAPDDRFWKSVIVDDDVDGCWRPVLEVVR